MKKYLLLFLFILLTTGCNSKLYTYNKVEEESKKRLANDIVVEDPGSFNRNNGLKAYTAYLERDKNKEITIINGHDYLLPIATNYLCTNFSDVYLVPKFNEFKRKNIYDANIEVESQASTLHPKCSDLKITIDCNEKEKYFSVIDKYIEYLNEDGIYLNKEGFNRYDIYCQDGSRYFSD